jgi:hypothetical protein
LTQRVGWKPREQFFSQEQDATRVARGREVTFTQGGIGMLESPVEKAVEDGEFALGQDDGA